MSNLRIGTTEITQLQRIPNPIHDPTGYYKHWLLRELEGIERRYIENTYTKPMLCFPASVLSEEALRMLVNYDKKKDSGTSFSHLFDIVRKAYHASKENGKDFLSTLEEICLDDLGLSRPMPDATLRLPTGAGLLYEAMNAHETKIREEVARALRGSPVDNIT